MEGILEVEIDDVLIMLAQNRTHNNQKVYSRVLLVPKGLNLIDHQLDAYTLVAIILPEGTFEHQDPVSTKRSVEDDRDRGNIPE